LVTFLIAYLILWALAGLFVLCYKASVGLCALRNHQDGSGIWLNSVRQSKVKQPTTSIAKFCNCLNSIQKCFEGKPNCCCRCKVHRQLTSLELESIKSFYRDRVFYYSSDGILKLEIDILTL
jgi:hypothetical protein